jgi:hypothetical protein
MKLDGINIVLALLILISLSVVCHLKQWIPGTELQPFSDISKYARLGCPYGSCAKEECSVIHAQLPDELVRGCGQDTSPTNFKMTDEDLKKILGQLYMAQLNYALQHKYSNRVPTSATTTPIVR